MQTIESSSDNKMSAIERALAAAKARKAAAAAARGEEETVTPTPKAKPEKKPKAEKPTDETKAAAKAQRDADRAARAEAKAAKATTEAAEKAAKKAAREAAKAEKAAAKAAEKSSKKPAHMKKVERARAKCPPLSEAAQLTFSEITTNLSAGQIDALAQHLLVHNRAMATIRATQCDTLPLGATVRITGGEAKWIGAIGKVVHSQKLRAKVEVPGVSKPVYIYNGQAEIVSEGTVAAVG